MSATAAGSSSIEGLRGAHLPAVVAGIFSRAESHERNPCNGNNDVDFARASRRPSIIDWLLFKPQLDAINTSLEVSRCDREQCCTR